jgi:hypothetical protein
MQLFHRIQDDARILDFVIFSDESTFHVNGKAYRPLRPVTELAVPFFLFLIMQLRKNRTTMYEEGCYAVLVYLALCGVSGQLGVPAVLQPGDKADSAHQIRGWIGHRVSLNTVTKRKIASGNLTPVF